MTKMLNSVIYISDSPKQISIAALGRCREKYPTVPGCHQIRLRGGTGCEPKLQRVGWCPERWNGPIIRRKMSDATYDILQTVAGNVEDKDAVGGDDSLKRLHRSCDGERMPRVPVTGWLRCSHYSKPLFGLSNIGLFWLLSQVWHRAICNSISYHTMS